MRFYNNTRTIEDKRTQREIVNTLVIQNKLLEKILAELKKKNNA